MREVAEQASGDILIFLDGDGADPPQYTPKLLKKLEEVDIVLGRRSMKKLKADDKKMRRVFKVYSFFIKNLFLLIDFRDSDPLAGFRIIRRKDWDKLKLSSNDFKIETEMNIKGMKEGFIIKEIQIDYAKNVISKNRQN